MSASYTNAKASLTDLDTYLSYIQKTLPTATTATYNGVNVITTFSAALSGPQQTTLTALVAAYADPIVGIVDTVQVSLYNTTGIALTGAAVFTGVWEDLSRYSSVTITALASQASAASGLSVQFGNAAAQADTTKTYTVAAATLFSTTLPVTGRWFRVVYTNGAVAQATFSLQCKFAEAQVIPMVDGTSTVDDNSSGLLTRNLNMARQEVGAFVSIRADESKLLRTRESGDSAFRINGGAQPLAQLDLMYNLSADTVATAVGTGGTVTYALGCAVLATSAAASSTATVSSRHFVHAGAGRALRVMVSCAFTTGVANGRQIAGWGSVDHGVFVGYNGTAFGVLVRSATVDTWTAATAFSLDKLNGTGPSGITLDPTKGNAYAITLDGSGFGGVTFALLSSPAASTSDAVVFHRVSFGNAATTVGLRVPSGPLFAQVANTTNATILTVRVASAAAYSDGPGYCVAGRLKSVDTFRTISSLTDAPLLSVFNKTSYQSINNYSSIVLQSLSVGVDGTKGMVVICLYDSATLTNASYADISANTSSCQLDTSATSMSFGVVLFSCCVQCTSCSTFDLSAYNIRVSPGMSVTVGAHCTASGIQNSIATSLCFREEC